MNIRYTSVEAASSNGFRKNKMANLGDFLSSKSRDVAESLPLIFNISNAAEQQAIKKIIDSGEIKQIIDNYEEQQQELFQVKNPTLVYAPDFKNKFQAYLGDLKRKKPLWQDGNWVFFPWI